MPAASTSVIQSTIDSAAALGMPAADQAALVPIGKRYQGHLNKLAEAIEAGDNKAAKHWQLKILKSDDAKFSALVRTAYLKDIGSGIALADVVAEAWALDLFQPIPGLTIARPEPKPEGGVRVITSFRWRRKAAQTICSDLLSLYYPRFGFDFQNRGAGGVMAAIKHLKNLIDQGPYDYVVVIDLANFFGSANKKKVEQLLPLPLRVTRNVLLIQDGEKVLVQPPKLGGTVGYPLSVDARVKADEAARRGVPQGSLASGLIMYRGVLGPLLGAQSFSDRIVLFGDDFAVPVKDKLEGEAVIKALEATFASTPVGLLHIGRKEVRNIRDGVDFLSHRIIRKPKIWGGHLHVRPSPKAYRRFNRRAFEKYCLAGGGTHGCARAVHYMRRWLKSFPLWQPTKRSKLYLWLELQSWSWFKRSPAGVQLTGSVKS